VGKHPTFNVQLGRGKWRMQREAENLLKLAYLLPFNCVLAAITSTTDDRWSGGLI
jgi:hypothetical protein